MPAADGTASRRARTAGRYRAFVPDPLGIVPVALDGATLALVSAAEWRIALLNASAASSARLAALGTFLLRAEAVGSSWIEGLRVNSRRLARAEAMRALGRPVVDRAAAEIVGNVYAMRVAVDSVAGRPRIILDDLLELHRVLMAQSDHAHLGGVIRATQNWIGGNGYNPLGASFVPPPPEAVPDLLEDLVAYANADHASPLVQAALVHAQFEAIHPFPDGNGRVGRALIHVVLRRRGLAPAYVPPISLVLATRADAYRAGLNTFAYEGSPDAPASSVAVREWIDEFAAAALQAALGAEELDRRIGQLVAEWRQRAAPIRASSAADLLIEALPGEPVLSPGAAAALIGRSPAATNAAIDHLVDAGILAPTTQHRWGRVFEAREVLDLLTWFERAAATATGDTRTDVPARPVPGPSPRARRSLPEAR